MTIRTSTLSLIIVMSTLFGLFIFGESANFLRASQTNENDVEASLTSELANSVDKGRLLELQDELFLTYESLPKDAAGNLGHKAVRYVLHRLFVQRHGWYIKGLEPNSDAKRTSTSDMSFMEWVPSFLQDRLEQRAGDHGTSLPQLAILAAALEDLIRKEAIARLRMAYEIHEFPVDGLITRGMLDQVIKTYYVSFLLASNFSATGPEDAEENKAIFASEYTGWAEAADWLDETMRSLRINGDEGMFNFSTASRMVLTIGEEYHKFNDLECKSLKHQLEQIEGRKAGRVRLSAFYHKSLYSHWRFDEKVDYLRTLGALDESDASQPQVILPNYLMARTNCLEASNFYALCCQNECEELMGHLEQKIGAPDASVDQIIELVAALPSASISAPRNLSEALLARLAQVAQSNEGAVPIHGRLFAQWMSHAFPRECPYPHEAGTTSPQTPDEWMQATGHESTKASKDEMLKQVESDACMGTGANTGSDCGGGDQGAELPWSETEELLIVRPSLQPQMDQVQFSTPHVRGISSFTLFLVATAGGFAILIVLDEIYASHRQGGLLGKDSIITITLEHAGLNLRAVLSGLACISLGSAACALELVDTKVIVIALCAGLLTHAIRVSTSRRLVVSKASLYKNSKFCV